MRKDEVRYELVNLVKAYNELSDREKYILKMRFGIEISKPNTLEDIGKDFNVTRERVRQMESKLLTHLSELL